jgi:GTPase SAR1 family protein
MKSVREKAPKICIILAGNKADLFPRIATDAAMTFAEHGVKLIETSAMTGMGVSTLFETVVRDYLEDSQGEPATDEVEEGPAVIISTDTCDASGKKCA